MEAVEEGDVEVETEVEREVREAWGTAGDLDVRTTKEPKPAEAMVAEEVGDAFPAATGAAEGAPSTPKQAAPRACIMSPTMSSPPTSMGSPQAPAVEIEPAASVFQSEVWTGAEEAPEESTEQFIDAIEEAIGLRFLGLEEEAALQPTAEAELETTALLRELEASPLQWHGEEALHGVAEQSPDQTPGPGSALLAEPQKDESNQKQCVCGNVFLSDSRFCRRCGRAVPGNVTAQEMQELVKARQEELFPTDLDAWSQEKNKVSRERSNQFKKGMENYSGFEKRLKEAEDEDEAMTCLKVGGVVQGRSAKLPSPSPFASESRGALASGQAAESAVSEGRHSITSLQESASGHASKNSTQPRRKPKRTTRNIFQEFGMDSDSKGVTEVDIGGIMVKRVNIKRFWQSESDLSRWQKGLNDGARFGKLELAERARYHEDFRSDRAALRSHHNSFRRQKSQPCSPPAKTAAMELRDLRVCLEPKELKGKAKAVQVLQDFRALQREAGAPAGLERPAAMGNDHGDAIFASEEESTAANRRLGAEASTERRYSHSQSDASQDPARTLQPQKRLLSAEVQCSCGNIFMPDSRFCRKCGAPVPEASSASAPRGLQQVQLPKTVTLLIFRNGESSHKGQPVLIKRWPLASMADLIRVCGEGCKPLIPPAVKLLDSDLRVVRSPDDMELGRAYLLKGTESLDPPALFYDHKARVAAAPTLRHIDREMHAAVAEQDVAPLSPKHQSFANISQASSGPSGSPPWLSQEKLEAPAVGLKWQHEGGLGAQLSWGGLGGHAAHHHYYTWSKVLPASRRGMDRRASASSSLY